MKNFLFQTVSLKTSRIFLVILVVAFCLVIYQAFSLATENVLMKSQLGDLTQTLKVTEDKLAILQNTNTDLNSKLQAEEERNNSFSSQVSEIAYSVGQLEKLKSIDPELLKKYSKVYFLNENYIPAKLSEIDSKYIYDPKKELKIHTDVLPFLEKMINAAKSDKVTLEVASAYRSFKEQAALKSAYKMTYGAGTANSFASDQGYSEHQMGTTVDLVTASSTPLVVAFDKTEAFKWLSDNAYKFGFILSYPKQNAYYQYEPWHWRFVGVALATKLHDDKLNFYDLDQRVLDPFLIKIFD